MFSAVWKLHTSSSHLVLEACAEDEVVVRHLLTTRHQDVFGLPVNAHHLLTHHTDAGVQRELGQVSAAVCMTAGNTIRYN